jgi:hypothetical protein
MTTWRTFEVEVHTDVSSTAFRRPPGIDVADGVS